MKILIWIGLLLTLTACTLPLNAPAPTATFTALPSPTVQPTDTPLPPSPTPTPVPPTETPIPPTATPTSTPLPPTETPTAIPTYTVLRGQVNTERVSCRYGPGAAYLYKFGLVGGSNLEIIGRNADGSWIEIQAIGGDNPCWMNAKYMTIKGDVLNVQPVRPEDVLLPMSPYYGPLNGVTAARSGEDVSISWNELVLRAGDDSEQFPYLVEVWRCQGGTLLFEAIGSYSLQITVRDEKGCSEASHGRVYGVEKHGYTRWVEIAWP